ncbi:MAG: pyridoxal 5'-phosphate synthase glutaminase subunit PdxT [Anaerolineaceae bacterium]|nr:pyridoxal 5'-phosphate synthase glutaminase subunit PdxT [Anaerolineaceae bacterium]
MLNIGVLALQGAFIEHVHMLRRAGAGAVEVRLPEELEGLDGLIIPGGESTTIGKLAVSAGLVSPLREFAGSRPTWGTCAGMIFLARELDHHAQPILALMDISVDRNAFGRQLDSFETDLDIPVLGEAPWHAVFIRAPVVTDVGDDVEVLARLADGRIVAVRQGHLLATAFHPELTDDLRFHTWFLKLVKQAG